CLLVWAPNLCRISMKGRSPRFFINRLGQAWTNRCGSTSNWKTLCGVSSSKLRRCSRAPAQATSQPIQCRLGKATFSFLIILSAGEVNKAVSAALAGKVVGTAIDGEKRYQIVVRMPDQFRGSDEQIRQLPLRVGDHGLIKLGDVAELKTVEVVEPILRDDGHRRAALLVNLDTRDVEGFVHNAEERIRQEVKMPE